MPGFVDEYDMNLAEFVLACRVRGLRARTIEFYEQRLGLLARFAENMGKELVHLDKHDLQRYILQRTGAVATGTVNCDIRAIKAFYNWLCDNDLITINPASRLKQLRMESRIKTTLTVPQLQRILGSFANTPTGRRDHLLALLMVDGCLRAGEVCNLTAPDIDLANRMLTVRGKSHSERLVPISPVTAQALHKWLLKTKPVAHVFLSRTGEPLTQARVTRLFWQLSKRLGFHVHAHLLRRTGATMLAQSGANIEFCRRILGHTDIRTTVMYIQLSDDALRQMHDRHSQMGRIA